MTDPQSFPETTHCLCLAARRASRSITRAFDQALRPHGLRATQFTLLSALDLAGPSSIGTLAEMLAAERTTVTRGLARLKERALVTVQVDTKDARARIARITPTGRQVLADAMPAWRETQQRLTAELGAEASAGLRRLAGGPCVMPLPTSPDSAPEEPAS